MLRVVARRNVPPKLFLRASFRTSLRVLGVRLAHTCR